MAMPPQNAVVSTVVRVEPPLVELADKREVRLDPEDERSAGLARVLGGLREQRLPVYLEVDPETSAITRLLIPHVSRVARISSLDVDVLSVELASSHGRHLLRRGAPAFEELEERLREALGKSDPVIVTETDDHEIIDVRPFVPEPEGPPLPFPERKPLPRLAWPWRWLVPLWRWPWWPWWWFRCVSPKRAQEVFDSMNATSCDPLTVPPPCIPFLYPDDGCWGRAHEMCRLMIAMGLSPRKVWIQGALNVQTKNNPVCQVWWGWHVAPTLCVRGPGFFQKQEMVVDPSLFATPVPSATWKGVQGDPNATLTDSDASIFYLWGGYTDPTYVQTNQVLATYRLQLQNRAVQHGPPPYGNCP
jgi:Glutaminase